MMDGPVLFFDEDLVLAAARERGWITAEDLAWAAREVTRDTAPVSGPYRGRVGVLVTAGRLREDDVAELLAQVGSDRTAGSDASGVVEGPRPEQLAAWGRYRVRRRLGAGGASVVYLADDPALERPVALKFLYRRGGLAAEARVQARLEHDHVCKVFEVGEVDGFPFIAMQYVEGQNLREAARDLRVDEIIAVMIDVADAIDAAHELGLIHRDLKPANVMVERGGDGRLKPYVVDFGLARAVADATGTVTGSIAGTPAYMAPEQARGERRLVDRRTDVYGLGATLYEALAGAPPFEGAGGDVLVRVLSEDPPSLRRRAPDLPVDLETVTMRCLERDPARRYPTARALADDLRRYLRGEPVQARRTGWMIRTIKWARRQPLVAGLAALVLVVAATGSGFVVHERALARRRAAAASDLTRELSVIRHAMRQAHLLPVHDLRPERAQVRVRMDAIRARMDELGPDLAADGHFALGAAHQALLEHDRALVHLGEAWALGHRGSEISLALGRAYGAVYLRRLARARRIEDADARARSIAELDRTLRDPALEHLARVGGDDSEEAPLAAALLPLVRGEPDRAVEAATAIAARHPWLYPARVVEAQARLALGKARFDAGDLAAARAAYGEAQGALLAASAIARSDPDLLAVACIAADQQLALRVMGAGERISSAEADAALTPCDQALVADPDRRDVAATKVYLLMTAARAAENRGEPAQPILERALALGRDRDGPVAAGAARDGAADLDAALGAVWGEKSALDQRSGRDPGPSLEASVRAFERALARDPRHRDALGGLGIVHRIRAESAIGRGQDPGPFLDAGARYLAAALETEPNAGKLWNNLGRIALVRAQHQLGRYGDATPALSEARRTLERAAERLAGSPLVLANLAFAIELQARDVRSRGGDPRALAAEAQEILQKALGAAPKYHIAHAASGAVHLLVAEWELWNGGDPAASLAAATRALEQALAANARHGRSHVDLGRTQVVAAEHLAAAGRDPRPPLARAAAHFARAAELEHRSEELTLGRFRAALVEARWHRDGEAAVAALRRADDALADGGRPSPALLAARALALLEGQRRAPSPWRQALGLTAAETALALFPDAPQALAARAALGRLAAQRAADAHTRAQILAGADRDWAEAVAREPSVRHDFEVR